MKENQTDLFFVKQAIEGYDAKIKLLEGKVEQLETIVTQTTMIGLQAMQLQLESLARLLTEKDVFTKEELDETFQMLYQHLEQVAQTRMKDEMTKEGMSQDEIDSAIQKHVDTQSEIVEHLEQEGIDEDLLKSLEGIDLSKVTKDSEDNDSKE